VREVRPSIEAREGAGFLVHRPFPVPGLELIDPFLLLDEMGPVDLGPGEAVGAPDHPHRGFETVTYLLSGEMEHEDSAGNRGRLRAGDVQWMTAGSGVVHSETPSKDFKRTGGHMHGFQLWVNLPRKQKMIAPRYQDTAAERIPTAVSADGKARVRVIAGESLGKRAVIDTQTPILYLHVHLEPGGTLVQTIPEGFNAFAYGTEGTAEVASTQVLPHHLAILEREGQAVELRSAGEPVDLLLIGGVPLAEPVARYGPFVMNTQTEIHQAIDDYQNGRLGRIQR
jgi:hypothetical protein